MAAGKPYRGICRNRSDEVMACNRTNSALVKSGSRQRLFITIIWEPVPIYITGNTATNDAKDILFALNMDGKILWQTEMGRAWTGSNPESRATPTVESNRVYTVVGLVILHASDATTGKMIWSYKASELNKGTFGAWGIAESLLVDGNKIYFSPGGPETMTIALNKATGDVLWKSPSLNDKPGYVFSNTDQFAGKKNDCKCIIGSCFWS